MHSPSSRFYVLNEFVFTGNENSPPQSQDAEASPETTMTTSTGVYKLPLFC